MITDKQLADIRTQLPKGWSAELYGIGICLCVVFTGTEKIGSVTVDFKNRGFRGGRNITGPMVSDDLPPSNWPGHGHKTRYTGRGWRDRLVADAVAWLHGVRRG